MHIFKIIFYSFLMLMLSSCGFHLRGEAKLASPFHKLYLQTPDPYSYLARNLREYLQNSHVQLTSSLQAADTGLVILQDENFQDLVSVNSTQLTRQYNLRVNVVFEIINNQGQVILGPQTLSAFQPITIQSNEILGSNNETTLFYQQLRQSLAYALINRIASQEVTAIVQNAFPKKIQGNP